MDKLSLRYWTSLVEPRECVKLPFKCDPEEYEQWLTGELTLASVDVEDWARSWNRTVDRGERGIVQYYGGNRIEIRLVWNTTGTRDIYLFKYDWDKSKISEEDRWTCEDGYVDGVYYSYPHIWW